jgi:hypothetical protein
LAVQCIDTIILDIIGEARYLNITPQSTIDALGVHVNDSESSVDVVVDARCRKFFKEPVPFRCIGCRHRRITFDPATPLENEEDVIMKKVVCLALCLLGGLSIVGAAVAQELIVYPKAGQSQEQMEKDKYACYSWAKEQSGFDPMAAPTASSPPPQQQAPQGGVFRGAARGALVGVAVGAIAGNAGEGAAIGAASGGLLGGMRSSDQRRQQEQAEAQWAQQQTELYDQKRGTYNRAYGACLEAKNYTVK